MSTKQNTGRSSTDSLAAKSTADRDLEHDGAASLRVQWLHGRRGGSRGSLSPAGWCVVRICACHRGLTITVPFDSPERAEHALAVLDADARQRWAAAQP
jgi:hypothetical protein